MLTICTLLSGPGLQVQSAAPAQLGHLQGAVITIAGCSHYYCRVQSLLLQCSNALPLCKNVRSVIIITPYFVVERLNINWSKQSACTASMCCRSMNRGRWNYRCSGTWERDQHAICALYLSMLYCGKREDMLPPQWNSHFLKTEFDSWTL